jgi:hypothetical protein
MTGRPDKAPLPYLFLTGLAPSSADTVLFQERNVRSLLGERVEHRNPALRHTLSDQRVGARGLFVRLFDRK